MRCAQNKPTMTNQEKITDWTNRIAQNSQDFRAAFGSLSHQELNWKPDASVWSIGQNIDHLIKINSSYFPVFEQLKNSSIKLPFTARLGFMNNFLGNFILKSVRPETRKKIKTLAVWEPIEGTIPVDILEQFEQNQQELTAIIKESEQYLDKRSVIYSPANKKITYTLEKAFEILTVHERRHLQQAQKVLAIYRNGRNN